MKSWLASAIFTVSLLAATSARAHAEDKQLFIYNWADYIGKNTLAKFEQATGIKVVYDTFDADTMLEAKVMAGNSDYDVVTTSADFFSRQIRAGVYVELDVGMHRVGVPVVADAVSLAKAVVERGPLTFEGIAFYPGHVREQVGHQTAKLDELSASLGAVLSTKQPWAFGT